MAGEYSPMSVADARLIISSNVICCRYLVFALRHHLTDTFPAIPLRLSNGYLFNGYWDFDVSIPPSQRHEHSHLG